MCNLHPQEIIYNFIGGFGSEMGMGGMDSASNFAGIMGGMGAASNFAGMGGASNIGMGEFDDQSLRKQQETANRQLADQ